MTVEEAGRIGGLRTSETHGSDFYSKIGLKGGESRGNKSVTRKDAFHSERKRQ